MVGGKTGGEFSGKVSRKRYDHDEGKKMSDECEPDEENERRKRTHLKKKMRTPEKETTKRRRSKREHNDAST